MRILSLLLVSLVAVALPTQGLCFDYSLVNLGALPGNAPSAAIDINSSGTVLGGYDETGNHGAVWTQEGGWNLIPIAQGYVSQNLFKINDNGLVAGKATTPFGAAMTWSASQGTRILANPGSATVYLGLGVNNLGDVVGAPNGGNDTYLWLSDGSTKVLGTTSPTGINDSRVVAGTRRAGQQRVAYRWTESGGVEDLPGLPDHGDSQAYRLNNAGQVVGWAYRPDLAQDAVLWDVDGHAIALGEVYNGASYQALALNNLGTVTGTSFNHGAIAAWIYDKDHGVRDLTSMVDPAQLGGWQLWDATGINDSGQICGFGTYNGQETAFVLNPVPEPVLAPTLGLFLFVSVRRRRKTRKP